jgi:hypothetical protein
MKKDTLQIIILGTVGGLTAAVGMCMCLIAEWNLLKPGIIVGVVGLLILLGMYPVYRKSHPIGKREINAGVVLTFLVGIIGALIMGFGMSKCLMPFQEQNQMVLGITVGIVGLLICILNCPIYLYLKSNQGL